MAADPQQAKSHAEIAAGYADIAGKLVAETSPRSGQLNLEHTLGLAQVAATLSVGARIADLTDRLEKSIEYVGDRIDE